MYESSGDCPLTQLLGRKHDIHEAGNKDEGVRELPRKCNWESEEKDEAEEECEDGSPPMPEGEQGNTPEESPTREKDDDQDSASTRKNLCSQRSQELCRTCEPGYMKIIVNMNEFSKTFAEELRLCTLCDHGLCPGSRLMASLRRRKCAHDECGDCPTRADKMGEDWCVCCGCGKGKDEFVVGFQRKLGTEITASRYQDGLGNSETYG